MAEDEPNSEPAPDPATVPGRPTLDYIPPKEDRRRNGFWAWLTEDPVDPRNSFVIARAIFLRGLGVVYLIAFLSLSVQIQGLVGSKGVLPIQTFIGAARLQLDDSSALGRFLQLPTLCWFNSSDGFLQFLCVGGAVLSGMLILGFAPVLVLALLWLFYLSLLHAGQVFLGFQWDSLLLEAGFLAIFFAPLELQIRPTPFRWPGKPPRYSHPSRIVLLLLWWLLFRLMFLSGLVKLIAQNDAWRSFTAMRYHYETQPLPTWTSWYAHLLPDWFQAISVGGVFFIEGLVPFLFFAPRKLRLFGCGMTILLQLLIASTGNFGFFNVLAVVLCLTLIDDQTWGWLRLGIDPARSVVRGVRWPVWLTLPLATAIFILSLVPSLARARESGLIPSWLFSTYRATAPFQLVNPYGLFEDMTTRRPEVVIEGSDDGVHWKEYEFKWKPGGMKRAPQFCAPHMPRLDWQMWFAALDVYYSGRGDVWLWELGQRLHEGSPPVLALMGTNPFPNHPPRYVRFLLYDYQFTTDAERRQTGAWWRRTLLQRLATIGPEQASQ